MYGDRVRGVDVRPSLLLMADLAPPPPLAKLWETGLYDLLK